MKVTEVTVEYTRTLSPSAFQPLKLTCRLTASLEEGEENENAIIAKLQSMARESVLNEFKVAFTPALTSIDEF